MLFRDKSALSVTYENLEVQSLKDAIEMIGSAKALGIEDEVISKIDPATLLNAIDLLSLAGHILSVIEEVPLIKGTGPTNTTIDWISLKQAKSRASDILSRDAEEFFLYKAENRFPKGVLDSKLNVKIREDILDQIHQNKNKHKNKK